ncbi:MAG: GAF domain-containing protein [Candidatus Lokiarchaeota archaeon]|nr:GAF domain-containing protein [Candidatus Lokiarchaeota archaeon]
MLNVKKSANFKNRKLNNTNISSEISSRFQNVDNLKELYQSVVEETFSRIRCEVAILYIFTSKDHKLLSKVAVKSDLSDDEFAFDSQYRLGEGIIGELPLLDVKILNLAEPLSSPHILKDITIKYKHLLPSKMFKHLLVTTLEISNEKFGVLKSINKKSDDYNLDNSETILAKSGFNKSDEKIIEIITRQAEIAYNNIKKLEDINRIHEIGKTLTSNKKLNEVLSHISDSALKFFGADIVTLYQYDQKRDIFLGSPIAFGTMKIPHRILEVPQKKDVVYQIINQGFSYFTSNSVNDPIMSRKCVNKSETKKEYFVFRENIKSTAAILMKINKEAVGVMFINYRRHVLFQKEDQHLMEIFGSYAAISIKNTREKEELTNKLTFSLSEIYNIRRLVDESSKINLETYIPVRVLEDILDFLGEELGYFANYDPDSHSLTMKVTSELYKNIEQSNWSADQGITGYAVRTKSIQNIPNVIENPHYISFTHDKVNGTPITDVDKDVKSSLSVPLMWEDNVYGVFHIESKKKNNFSEYDVQMIKALSDQAANAIQNIRLIRQRERARKKLQALGKLDTLIASTWNLDKVFEFIVNTGIELTNPSEVRGHISLVENVDGKDYLIPYAILGPHREKINLPLEGKIGITRLAVLQNRTINVSESDDLWKKYYSPLIESMRSELVEPLRIRGKPIGAINLESPILKAFNKEDEELLKILAGQAVIVIQMTRLVNDIRSIGLSCLTKTRKELSDLILERAGELLGAKIGTIRLYDSAIQKFCLETYFGMEKDILHDESDLTLENSFAGYVLKSKKILTRDINELLDETGFEKRYFIKIFEAGFKTITAVPFYSGNEMIGVMNLYSKERYFINDKEWEKSWEKNLLELFATQASIALQNVLRYEALQTAKKEIEESVHISIFENIKSMVRLITHRMNNSVGNIRADIIELLDSASQLTGHEILEFYKNIKFSAQEALNIPVELNKFIEKLNSKKMEVDIYYMINDIVSEREFKDIEISYEHLKNMPTVRGNYAILKESFSEIMKNATKAMPNGGKIFFRGQMLKSKMSEILIQDTGHGIAKESINKIFEYGFTEWKNAKGMGDGLAILKTVIEVDHKGKIDVESEEGKGCTFKIQLPIFNLTLKKGISYG